MDSRTMHSTETQGEGAGNMKTLKFSLILLVLLLMIVVGGRFSWPAAGESTGSQSHTGIESQDPVVRIENVPFEMKRPDFGGEACVAMFAQSLGKALSQDMVFELSGVAPTQGRGCATPELAKAVKRLGFQTGPVWYQIDESKKSI